MQLAARLEDTYSLAQGRYIVLQMLQCVCTHLNLPIADDPEVQRLAQRTEPESLFKELTDRLPENSQ